MESLSSLRLARRNLNPRQLPSGSTGSFALILQESNDLLGGAGESLGEAEQEILSRLNRARMGGERLHVEDLLIEFRRRPYGWYEAATLCLLARLFKRNKIEVRQGAATLTSEQLIAALSNSRMFGSTAVQIQEEFDSTIVTALKNFHHEFFDRANPGSDAKSAAQWLLEAFGDEVHALDGLLTKSEKFPFVERLRSTRDQLYDLSRKDYTYPLRNLRNFCDDLLDAKEDALDPIKAFVNGAQGALYVDVCRFLAANSPNLGAEPSQVKELREIATTPNPYRGTQLQQAKISLEAVRNQIQSALEKTRVWATAEIQQRVDTLQCMPEFAKLDDAIRARILEPSRNILQAINGQPLLPVIRDSVRQYTETVFSQQLAEVARAAAAKTTGGESNGPVEETPLEFVSIRELASPLGRPFLASAEDVDRYVAEFTDRLRAAIASGALRYLDAKGWHPFHARVLTPVTADETQPELLRQVRGGTLPNELRDWCDPKRIDDLLAGRKSSGRSPAPPRHWRLSVLRLPPAGCLRACERLPSAALPRRPPHRALSASRLPDGNHRRRLRRG